MARAGAGMRDDPTWPQLRARPTPAPFSNVFEGFIGGTFAATTTPGTRATPITSGAHAIPITPGTPATTATPAITQPLFLVADLLIFCDLC